MMTMKVNNKGEKAMAKSKKNPRKIPVLHYTEITDTTQLNGVEMSETVYLTNEGGKQYLVEVWA